jgi:hypothetical protein
MSWVATGIAAVSTGLQVYGAVKKGQDESEYYHSLAKANNRQADETLKVAGQNQALIQDQAALESGALRRQQKTLNGQQRVAMAASGTSSGATAEDITRDTFDREKLDQLLIRYNADAKTRSLGEHALFTAAELRNQGGLYNKAGDSAATAGWLNAASSLLGGASQVGGYWSKMGGSAGQAGSSAGNSYV